MKRYMKRCSGSLIIRKCKLKPQSDITLHLLEWLSSINQQTASLGEDVFKEEPSYTISENVDWSSYCEKQYEDSLKNYKLN